MDPEPIRRTVTITKRVYQLGTQTKSLSEWCRMYGVTYRSAYNRLLKGQTIEQALRLPPSEIAEFARQVAAFTKGETVEPDAQAEPPKTVVTLEDKPATTKPNAASVEESLTAELSFESLKKMAEERHQRRASFATQAEIERLHREILGLREEVAGLKLLIRDVLTA